MSKRVLQPYLIGLNVEQQAIHANFMAKLGLAEETFTIDQRNSANELRNLRANIAKALPELTTKHLQILTLDADYTIFARLIKYVPLGGYGHESIHHTYTIVGCILADNIAAQAMTDPAKQKTFLAAQKKVMEIHYRKLLSMTDANWQNAINEIFGNAHSDREATSLADQLSPA